MMTWAEFKRRVEAQGVTDLTELAWIDVIGWRNSPMVTQMHGGSVAIVQRDGRTA
jgi:hypothetical protein